MVAQAVESRGRVVFSGRKVSCVCGRCNALQPVPYTRDRFTAFSHAREQHDWRFSEPHGYVCRQCVEVVNPDALRRENVVRTKGKKKAATATGTGPGTWGLKHSRHQEPVLNPDRGERQKKVMG